MDSTVSGIQDGTSWTDAFTGLSLALCVAQTQPAVTEVRVAGGVYTPAGAGGDRAAVGASTRRETSVQSVYRSWQVLLSAKTGLDTLILAQSALLTGAM